MSEDFKNKVRDMIMELKKTTVATQTLTLREKAAIKSKHKHTCVYCGCRNRVLLTVEHKTPLSRGATSETSNLACSCMVCNQLKGGLTHTEFIEYLKHLTGLNKLGKAYVRIPNVNVDMKPGSHPGLMNG